MGLTDKIGIAILCAFVLFSVVGQLDIVCMGRCPHRPAVDCFISQINCHICNFHFNMVYYKSKAIPHKDCATDASSNFSSDETKSGVNT